MPRYFRERNDSPRVLTGKPPRFGQIVAESRDGENYRVINHGTRTTYYIGKSIVDEITEGRFNELRATNP